MHWLIQLAGDSADLKALAQSLTGTNFCVKQSGDEYVLQSDQFSTELDATEIHNRAKQIVTMLSGATRLAVDGRTPIVVGAVYRQDDEGKRHIFVFPPPAVIHVSARIGAVQIGHADGTVEKHYPADPVKQWLPLAISNPAVADVFRIIDSGKPDWVNLYRLLEIVAADVGGFDNIVSKGWASKAQLELFKRTAQHPDAIGVLNSRHGFSRHEPPSNPMALGHAQTLVKSIIFDWMREKIR